MVLTKNKLVAFKNNDVNISYDQKDILINENRNKNESSYDISIRNKTIIQPENCIPPTIIGNLPKTYITNKISTVQQQKLLHTTRSLPKKYSSYHVNHIIKSKFDEILDPIINRNKQDFQTISIIFPSLNVIIRRMNLKKI